MTHLSDYINFAHSLIDMDEVKNGNFPQPSEIVFHLTSIDHAALQTQVHDAKGLEKEDFEHQVEFIVSVAGIDFKFKQNDEFKK